MESYKTPKQQDDNIPIWAKFTLQAKMALLTYIIWSLNL